MKNFLNVSNIRIKDDEISEPIAYGGLAPREDLAIYNNRDK